MYKQLWRKTIAPRLVRRLAPRVAEILLNDPAFAYRHDRSSSGAPAEPETPLVSFQLYRGYETQNLQLFERLRKHNLKPAEDFITDFLGCRIRLSSIHDANSGLGNTVLGFPIPCDYHAEAVEWIGLLKTALTAKDRYVAMEWGCRMGSLADRRRKGCPASWYRRL